MENADLIKEFKEFIRAYHKTEWHVLNDETLQEALAIFNGANSSQKLSQFWD